MFLHIYFMCWMGRFLSISACGIWDAECSNRLLHYASSGYVYYIRVYTDECENVAYSVPSFYDVYCIWSLLCWMRNHYLPNTHLEVEVLVHRMLYTECGNRILKVPIIVRCLMHSVYMLKKKLLLQIFLCLALASSICFYLLSISIYWFLRVIGWNIL